MTSKPFRSEFFRLMVEHAGEEIYLVRPDGSFAYVNAAAAASLGYTVEEMLPLGIPGIDAAHAARNYTARFDSLKAAPSPPFETVHVTKDGRERVKEVKSVHVSLGGEEFLLGFARDVTDRKASEEQLRDSERRFRTLVESLPGLAVQCVDREARILYWNEASERLYGYTAGEAVGHLFYELLVGPELRPRVLEAFRQWMAGGPKMADGELDLVHRDGRTLHVYSNRVRLPNARGEDEVYRVDVDLTDRLRAEEALRRKDELFRHFVENIQDVIVVIGREGKILYESPSLLHVLGRTPQERIGKDAFEFVHPEDRPALQEFFRERLALPGPIPPFSMRFQHRDGSYRHLEAVGTNLVGDPAVQGMIINLRDVTERVRAQQELQAAVERAEQERAKSDAIVASVGDGISIQGPDFRVLYQNEGHRRLIGDRVGLLCYEAYECRDSVCEGCPVAASFADGKTHVVERHAEVPGGGSRHVEITASSVRDAQGKVVFGIEVVRDVTERHRYEAALAESERLYRLLFERNLGGVYRSSPDGRVLECNLAFARIMGCDSVEEVKALPAESFYVDQADRAAFLEAIRRDGAVSNFRERLRGRDGRELTILLNANLIAERPGEAYIEGTLLDITELERATDALRRSERRLKNIVEHSTNLFYSHTADGTITYVSPQIRTFFDCVPEDLTGSWSDYVADTPANRAGFEATRRAIETGERQPPYELELKTRTGRTVWVEVNEAPVVRDGKTHSIVGSLTDITARKRAEEEAAGLQARLQQSQKLESLGILAGGISHDFNNLLVGILGNADLALMDPGLPAPARHRLEEVRMAAIRASELTAHMLAYSGQGQLAVAPVDLNALVEELAVLMEASISRKAALRYAFGKELPPVEGDPVQLRQVVMNLILNASESLGEKSGLIQMSTSVQEMDRRDLDQTLLGTGLPPGPYVSLAVSDTGCGMDAETQERIFDPFYTTKRSGRGLGLAVVLGIVRSHRGTLRVFSDPGRGSRFEVCFPVVAGAVAPPRPETEADLAPRPGAGSILLVDDDAAVREVASAMLEGLGYSVVAVPDGREALAHAQAQAGKLDAVLLDLALGEMDGEEVLRGLKALRADLPVVLLTGRAPREVEHRMRGLPVDAVLRKPFRRADLVKVLRELTGR